jgi:aminopeptidase YwaD
MSSGFQSYSLETKFLSHFNFSAPLRRRFSIFTNACLLFLQLPIFAQEPAPTPVYTFARQVLDTLCAPGMHGRGYVAEGGKIAANYLEEQFKTIGLRSFYDSFRQEFSYPVNTFPGAMFLSIDGKALIPGKDYLILSGATRFSGTYKIALIDPAHAALLKHKKSVRHHAIVLSDSLLKRAPYQRLAKDSLHTKVVCILVNKLTWDVPEDTSYLQIQLRNGLITSDSKELQIRLENKFIRNYPARNLVGYIRGTEYPDSFLVLSAHYDHLGRMGRNTYFPGANDNASGCAMLLSLAKYYAQPANKPRCSVVFIAFSGEEAGLIGSSYFTQHPFFPIRNIRFLTNLDILGTGDEGITVVNGTLFPAEFNLLKTLNEKGHFLPDVRVRGKSANSDHYFFSERGVKAFFIYTRGGIKAYHDVYDKAATLPLTRFEDLYKLLCAFEKELDAR